MKPRVILTAAVLLLACYLQAQDWIGSIWTLDTSITLKPELQDLDFSHIKVFANANAISLFKTVSAE